MSLTIGERIKTLRKQQHMTQTELGELVGVGKSSISKYENNEIKDIPLEVLGKLNKALNNNLADALIKDSLNAFGIKNIPHVNEIFGGEGHANELFFQLLENIPKPEDVPLRYEDDSLLVINKQHLKDNELSCINSIIDLIENQHQELEKANKIPSE